ncbi:MAG: hypothetical protein JST04_12310 [Bdellovibrionales bacterium]|nr:hypothetical protein [Bdellovibrionales bacterium]
MDTHGEVKIGKRKRGSVIVLVISGIAAAAFYRSLVNSSGTLKMEGAPALAFIALLLDFVFLVPLLLFKVLDFRPALIISAEGIRCRGVSTLPNETVPWSYFSGFRIRVYRQFAYLELGLEEESAFLVRYPKCERPFARSKAMFGVSIPILAQTLAIEPAELEALFEARLPRLPNV